MVGGTVIEVRKHPQDGMLVWCMDAYGDECAIVVEDGYDIEPQDKIWWQGDFAYWTTRGGTIDEKEIRRLSNSFDPRKVIP